MFNCSNNTKYTINILIRKNYMDNIFDFNEPVSTNIELEIKKEEY